MERTKILLSTQLALLGMVTPNMQAITIRYKQMPVLVRIFFIEQPTEDEIELLSEITTEIIADYSEINNIIEDFYVNQEPECLDDWVYYQYSTFSTIKSEISKFNIMTPELILLSAQKAMLKRITNNMQEITIRFLELPIILRIYFKEQPTSIDLELINKIAVAIEMNFNESLHIKLEFFVNQKPEWLDAVIYSQYKGFN